MIFDVSTVYLVIMLLIFFLPQLFISLICACVTYQVSVKFSESEGILVGAEAGSRHEEVKELIKNMK